MDDKTNKPCGAGEFMKVDSSEYEDNETFDNNDDGMDSKSLVIRSLVGSVVTGIVIFFATKFPSIKKGVMEFWNNKTQKKKSTTTEIIAENSSEESDVSFEVKFKEYGENMSSDEAKKELIEAFVLKVIAAKKLERVIKSDIIDENGKKQDKQALINEVTNPALISEINSILSDNPYLITQQQIIEISSILGYNIISDGKYMPILPEILHKRLD
ncbi:MAG: hypothetical protein NC177_17835 [Ruminococcus flavefaciens]|nr:hypothetical protein [Ruminococcus flavefaciens]